jgi:predicted RNA binding protein YcfA (HicA-like mRNA interferase family)
MQTASEQGDFRPGPPYRGWHSIGVLPLGVRTRPIGGDRGRVGAGLRTSSQTISGSAHPDTLLPMSDFPAMRWPELSRVLTRAPLLYSVERTRGSHKTLRSSAGYPDLHLAFHDNAEIPGGLVKKILCGDVGLTEQQVRALL